MKLKLVRLLLILVFIISLFPVAVSADDPFALDAPQNLNVKLKYDNEGMPYFELRMDIPSKVREINASLSEDPESFTGIYCQGIEIVFDYKYGTYDWNKGPSPYWNTSDYLSGFIDRGGYWEYHPYGKESPDYVDVKTAGYTFRARFYALWGNSGDWTDNEIYSGYSNVAAADSASKQSIIVPAKPPVTPTVTPTLTVSPSSSYNKNAPYSIYAWIDGIPGESTDAAHRDQIDVLSLSFGGQTNAKPGLASASQTEFNTLKIVKAVDRSSPKLLDAMAKGLHIKDVRIFIDKPGNPNPNSPDLKITLQDLIISSYRLNTSSDGKVSEEIGISFMKAEYEYNPKAQDGTIINTIRTAIDLRSINNLSTNANIDPTAGSNQLSNMAANTTYDMFAWFDSIPGDSNGPGHRDQIDVISCSFEGHNNALPGVTSAGKPQFDTLKIVKAADKASPKLLDAMAKGMHIRDVKLFIDKPNSTTPGQPVLKITLQDLLISSYKLKIGNDGQLLEEIGISFMKADYEYNLRTQNGTIINTLSTSVNLVTP